MRKIYHRIFGFLLIALAVIHLTEGTLLTSIISQTKLKKYAITLEDDLLSWETADSSDKNVSVKIYNDKNNPNVYYILEYSKNPLLQHTSLKDVTKYDHPSSPIHSVASTVFSHYPYSIDLQDQIITIYEKTNSYDWIRSVFLFGLGILCAFLPNKNKEKHT